LLKIPELPAILTRLVKNVS